MTSVPDAMAETTEPREGQRVQLEDLVRVGPGTLAGRFLRRFWHPAIPARLVEHGSTRPMRLLGEDFTLYRSEEGEFHAVGFRCAHRGVQLSTGWVEGDCIRCCYHGWKYDASGQCVEQPDEREGFAAHIKIRGYPVREYLGLVFVYLGAEDPAPPLPRFAAFEGQDLATLTYSWPCSYFNSLENDAIHVNWVHRPSIAAAGMLTGPGEFQVSARETEFGYARTMVRPKAPRDQYVVEPHIMPNAFMFGQSAADGHWSQTLAWRVPVDDEHFRSCSVSLGGRARPPSASERLPAEAIAEAVLRGEIRVQDIPQVLEDGLSDSRLFNVQDYVSQVGQGTFGLLFADEHLGRNDAQVSMIRRLYRRELQALADGVELKVWSVPEDLTILHEARNHSDD